MSVTDQSIPLDRRTSSSPIHNNPETPILGMPQINGHASTRQRQSLSAQRSASPHVTVDGNGKKKKTAKKGWKGWALVVEDEAGNVIEVKDPEPSRPVTAGSVDLTPLPSREGSALADIPDRPVELGKKLENSLSPAPLIVSLPRE